MSEKKQSSVYSKGYIVGEEVWMPIPGFKGLYSVSNIGRVMSLKRKTKYTHRWGNSSKMNIPCKILSNSYNRGGYCFVYLRKNGMSHHFDIHRLVAMAFITNPQKKPCVNHKNGAKDDNRVENLEWCTYSENNIHAQNIGLIKRNGGDNPRAVGVVIEKGGVKLVFETQREAAKHIGCNDINVSKAKINQTRCFGYKVTAI